MILETITIRCILARVNARGGFFRIDSNASEYNSILAKLKNLGPGVEAVLKEALREEGHKLILTAMDFVPIEDGELMASGAVRIRSGRHETTMYLSFGGPAGTGNVLGTNSIDVNYAAAVHEIPPPPGTEPMKGFARHGAQLTPPLGPKPMNQQWKFLEKAADKQMPGLRRAVTARVRRKLGT